MVGAIDAGQLLLQYLRWEVGKSNLRSFAVHPTPPDSATRFLSTIHKLLFLIEGAHELDGAEEGILIETCIF